MEGGFAGLVRSNSQQSVQGYGWEGDSGLAGYGSGTRFSLPLLDEVCYAFAYRKDSDVDVGPDTLGHD